MDLSLGQRHDGGRDRHAFHQQFDDRPHQGIRPVEIPALPLPERDELVLEIVAAEVGGSSPDMVEALADVFASQVLGCEEHLRGTGLELAACMFDYAARLREPLVAN